jgi:(p)ppGpp synthase/HD superfamily hydrolase
MEDEETTVVALLHDVIEDTDMTIDALRDMGFSERVISAIALMTHAPEVPYMDYVRAIKTNDIARQVKLADLAHNSDLSRLDEVDEYALKRNEKYKQAREILNS